MAGTRNPLLGPTAISLHELGPVPKVPPPLQTVPLTREQVIKHLRGKGRWRGTFHIQTIISRNIYDSVFMLVLSVFYVLHEPVVSSLTSVCGHECGFSSFSRIFATTLAACCEGLFASTQNRESAI